MDFVHPDRARNLGSARVQDGREFSVKGHAGGSSPAQGRKRKWSNSRDEQSLIGGGEVRSPDGYTKTGGDGLENQRPEQVQGAGKKAKYDRTRTPRPNAIDADRSRRPETKATDPRRRNAPRRPANKQPGRRTVDEEKLHKARQLAPKYPDLRNVEAWRTLGQTTERTSQAEHAFVYRHLRFDQCPKGLALKAWKIRVHREMEGLGLEDVYRGPYVKRASEDEVKGHDVVKVAKDTLVIIETEEDQKRRREMERLIADDGFDIDIYGDEATRRKYEPWIRSRMDRT